MHDHTAASAPDRAAQHADALVQAIDAAGSPVCVGFDPVLERLPPGGPREPGSALAWFGEGVVRAVAGVVGVVKPQSACFERFGAAGAAALARVVHAARDAGMFVILDAKRGDIGETSAHYAHAAALLGAHAVTVNAYMGRSAVAPFLDAGLMVFVLVRTSNADSAEVQAQRLADGSTVAERMASLAGAWGRARPGRRGLTAVGGVVGATRADEGAALRARMPDAMLLIPGVGAQGGQMRDLRPMLRSAARSPGELGVVVNASRSVLYPGQGADGSNWQEAVRARAQALADDGRTLA